MKRSEMLEYMEQLCAREGIKPWNVTVEQFCDEMLAMVEEVGMRPPYRKRTEHERKIFGTREDNFDLSFGKQDWDKE